MQLKVIQEVISLTVFTLVAMVMFKGQSLQWNHIAAFFCLIMAVFFVFLKLKTGEFEKNDDFFSKK